VRFLIDAQLPPLLVRYLAESGHQAEHVGDVGLLTAPDRAIWSYALEWNAALITKDEDFITMRALSVHGPSIIWVRLGNTTRRALLSRFSAVFPDIVAALQRGETVIEISGERDD
jgi:predicted nuclease of predicted toxin-antitoxin system